MRNDGAWKDLHVKSPRTGEGVIKVYVKADQSSAQNTQESSHRWRCLKRACGTLGREDLVFDIRDKLVSLDHHAIAQLESSADDSSRGRRRQSHQT